MPGAVEFMAVVNIFPAVFGIDHREVRVEVAVRLLGGDHEIDVAVKFAGQRLIVRIQREHERHSLEDLCEVGVPEDMRPVRHTLFPGEAEHIDPPVSRHLATEDGIVDVRHASTRSGKDRIVQFHGGGIDR